MKKQSVLKYFEYRIQPPAMTLAETSGKHVAIQHMPLMKVAFDFEKGKMKLEGDWHFMINANKHNETNWFTGNRERVRIDASILPVFPINFDDPATDGLMLPLEGKINDGESIGDCSGLIVLDAKQDNKKSGVSEYRLSFYVYDLQYEYCEINFKLPVFNNLAESEIN